MRSIFRAGVIASVVTVSCGVLGAGIAGAGTGSADMFDYPPPAPTVTLLPHGVVRIEAGVGTPGGGSWWCGGATFDPPSYVVAPHGAPLPQDLQFPPGSVVNLDCSSGEYHSKAQIQTLP